MKKDFTDKVFATWQTWTNSLFTNAVALIIMHYSTLANIYSTIWKEIQSILTVNVFLNILYNDAICIIEMNVILQFCQYFSYKWNLQKISIDGESTYFNCHALFQSVSMRNRTFHLILKSDKTKSKNIIFNPLDNFRKMYVTRHYTSPCCFSFVVADKVCIKSLYIIVSEFN